MDAYRPRPLHDIGIRYASARVTVLFTASIPMSHDSIHNEAVNQREDPVGITGIHVILFKCAILCPVIFIFPRGRF